jgi:hypothetical protein
MIENFVFFSTQVSFKILYTHKYIHIYTFKENCPSKHSFLFCALVSFLFFLFFINVYLCIILLFWSRMCQFRLSTCVCTDHWKYRETSVVFFISCSYCHLYPVSLSPSFFFFLALKQILYEFYINEDHVVYENDVLTKFSNQVRQLLTCTN